MRVKSSISHYREEIRMIAMFINVVLVFLYASSGSYEIQNLVHTRRSHKYNDKFLHCSQCCISVGKALRFTIQTYNKTIFDLQSYYHHLILFVAITSYTFIKLPFRCFA